MITSKCTNIVINMDYIVTLVVIALKHGDLKAFGDKCCYIIDSPYEYKEHLHIATTL